MNEEQLQQIDIFKSLDTHSLSMLASITHVKKFSKENILFYEGEEASYFYALIEGGVKLYKTGFKANEIVLHYFTTPTLIAEMVALENIKFPASAVVMRDDTLIALIEKEKFLQMLKEDNEFSFYIIKSLTKKIKNLEQTINRNLIFDATTKVCSMVAENPNFLIEHKNIQIANILNMAPETLSRILSKLKKLGILNKQNELLDSQKLQLYLEFGAE